MGIKKGQEIELTITDIAFGGKGLAKVEDFVIFVDRAITHDHVRAKIIKKKKKYADARILEILEPSPLRVKAPCLYNGFCGGCKWQSLNYNKQIEYKTKQVADAIRHIGLMDNVPVHQAIPSERIFGYRNKMEFSCSDRKWLMPDEFEGESIDAGFGLGLHVPGTFFKVIDIKECFLQPELGNSILDTIRGYIKESNVPVFGLRSHQGFWRFVVLRHSVFYDKWMVNLVTSTQDMSVVEPLARLLTERYPKISSVVNNITSRNAGVAVGEHEVLLAGEPYIKDKLRSYEFKISANSFFQTNTRGAEQLYTIVKEYARLTGSETVLDMYSGTGTIPLWLSDSAKEVIGIEIIESAVRDAEKNCINNNVENCRFILGDIRKTLPDISINPDVMIIDPPRVGMHKDVVEQVINIGPERIVYVSCNPSTLARDINLLREYYTVMEVQPVDMFPHTTHIESVTRLEKK